MNGWRLARLEAWSEIRAGLRSGIVALIFVGLVGYLLLSLTNAGYVEKMGSTDVPRNAPSLIYLMSTGCMFFLFFAWAWVFAQPLLRDRQASLHEVVLSTPNSVTALLWGRFVGAAVVGALLGGSVIIGFLATPLLEWWHLVPPKAMGPTPWHALWSAWIWLVIPIGVGVGALYFAITLRVRHVAGAFGLSAVLMLLWMVAVVALQKTRLDPWLAASLDPSLFTFAQAQVMTWTPHEKATAWLSMSQGFWVNRLLWCVLPLLVLAWVLQRTTRELLVLETSAKRDEARRAAPTVHLPAKLPAAVEYFRWWSAVRSEAAWQCRQLARSRMLWVGGLMLIAMAVLSSYIHVVWTADGPMVPRLELLLPLLHSATFLVIAFLVAALAGLICRRDDVPGFDHMVAATPAPDFVRLLGRASAVVGSTLLFALLPGVAGMLVTALSAPGASHLGFMLGYQLLVTAPPLVELALLIMFVHMLVPRAGVAYVASMLLTFVLVLNHELELVSHPLAEIGIAAAPKLSAITGWAPWMPSLLAIDGYKLSLSAVLISLAGLAMSRDNGGWRRRLCLNLAGPVGALGVIGMVGMVVLGVDNISRQLAADGYRSPTMAKDDDAAWERRWSSTVQPTKVSGGELSLLLDPQAREVRGQWQLHQVRAVNGMLQLELPRGLTALSAQVADRKLTVDIADDHASVSLGECPRQGCEVLLTWQLKAPTGMAPDSFPWLTPHSGIWLRAQDVVPRIGIDPERMLRAPIERERRGLTRKAVLPSAAVATPLQGVATAARWQWKVTLSGGRDADARSGQTQGPLNFSEFWADDVQTTVLGGLTIVHDSTRATTAHAVAEDVAAMHACVSRRLGPLAAVRRVVQWPRGFGDDNASGELLSLSEAPDWDVADAGVGRWLRRSNIAAAMAREAIASEADLRRGPGSAWLSDGVAGALGLLCVGDTDGLDAMRQVMAREAEQTTRDLAASDVPVGDLSTAVSKGWVEHYAPLAALGWTARQRPTDLAALLKALKDQPDIETVLTQRMGQLEARAALGPPRAFEPADRFGTKPGKRRLWRSGSWQDLPEPTVWARLVRTHGIVGFESPAGGNAPVLQSGTASASREIWIDALPSYGRSFATPP